MKKIVSLVILLTVLALPLGVFADGPCDSATQADQCAYVDIGSLPPFADDTATAEGVNTGLDCGNVLILSSGEPLDGDGEISTDMSNPGCGTNPDGYDTYDCVDILGFTPDVNSIVLAVSSEWPEYQGSDYTDWMRIGGIVDVSIDDWGTANLIPYGPSNSGTKTLATLGAGEAVDLRVADSGDEIYDTALIVIPLECFEDEPEPLLCGDGQVQPGEECDDGNTDDGDGCSSVCLIEEEGDPFCGDGNLDTFEQCDDGNNADGDGCSAKCQFENVPPDGEVPEFTTIGVTLALAGAAGIALSRRRK
ncbi:MAG: hypothetical protein QS98_C0011G0009 [archaeon GW2011_AR3]|nr:MAG: hypothetical protein QS98_C0011G0009 [archaeon GW2011_AR3]